MAKDMKSEILNIPDYPRPHSEEENVSKEDGEKGASWKVQYLNPVIEVVLGHELLYSLAQPRCPCISPWRVRTIHTN